MYFFLFFFSILPLGYSQLGYTETGWASYYSDKFHGRYTASGERYNKNALTAAHRTLAFGTKVKVTNLRNGKSVIVRINDRGPWVEGRIIDLSKEAARRLDMLAAGTVPVRIEVVETSPEHSLPPPKPKPKPKTKPFQTLGIYTPQGYKVRLRGYGIQIASFQNLPLAQEYLRKTAAKHKKTYLIVAQDPHGKKIYKIVVGNFSTYESAKKNLKKFQQGFIIRYEQALRIKFQPFSRPGIYTVEGKIVHPRYFGIQLGSFSRLSSAQKKAKQVQEKGYKNVFIIVTHDKKGKTIYKVALGRYENYQIAKKNLAEIQKKDLWGFVIRYQDYD